METSGIEMEHLELISQKLLIGAGLNAKYKFTKEEL